MASTSPARSSDLTSDQRFGLRFKVYDEIGQTVRIGFKFGTLAFAFWCSYRSVAVLAGQQTLANIVVNFLANIRVSQGIAYIFGTGGIIYGVAERKTRQRAIQRLSKDKNELEKLLDPARTSSHLTAHGTTRPGDER
jgi:hypothetical protein